MEIIRSGRVFIRGETQSAHTHSRIKAIGCFVNLAKSDQGKFLRSFFQKANGVKRGSAPEKTAFSFCEAFSFALISSKEKAIE